MLMRRHDAKYMNNCRVLRGTSLDSDHHLPRANCKFPGRFCTKKTINRAPPIDATLLGNRDIKKAFDAQVQIAYQSLPELDSHHQWEQFKAAVQSAQGLLVSKTNPNLRIQAITPETELLIAEKRSAWMRYVNEKKKSPGSHNHHGINQSQVPGEKKQRASGG